MRYSVRAASIAVGVMDGTGYGLTYELAGKIRLNRKRDFELCEAVYDGESSQVNVAPSHPVGVSVLGNDFRVGINNV